MARASKKSIGGGKLYIQRYNDDGTLTPIRRFGATSDLNYSIKIDTVEITDTEEEFESVAETAVKKKTASIEFKTSDITADMLYLALAGTKLDKSQLGGSVTDEAHSASEIAGGAFVKLGKINVSNVIVSYIDDNGDEQQAVEGADYKVVAQDGLIEILDGSVVIGRDITVDYDYETTTIEAIEAMTRSQTQVKLLFFGRPQKGKKIEAEFYKVNLTASGDIKLKDTSKFIELPFSGDLLNTGDKENPFFNIRVVEVDNG